MKRIIIFAICCLISFGITSKEYFADTNEFVEIEGLGDERSDLKEIWNLRTEILGQLDEFVLIVTGENLPQDFDIDLSDAKKIYVDSDIFSLESDDREAVSEALDNSNYMWLLLIDYNGDTYQVNIARGLPLNESVVDLLTDDEIQQIKENEGKWTLTGIEIVQNETIDYEQMVAEELNEISYDMEDAEVVICGGLQHISQPAALIMKDDRVDLIIPLYHLEIEGSEEQIESIKPESAGIEDEVYLYSEIMNAVNDMGDDEQDTDGGDAYIVLTSDAPGNQHSLIYFLVIVVTLLTGLVAICILRKRSHRS